MKTSLPTRRRLRPRPSRRPRRPLRPRLRRRCQLLPRRPRAKSAPTPKSPIRRQVRRPVPVRRSVHLWDPASRFIRRSALSARNRASRLQHLRRLPDPKRRARPLLQPPRRPPSSLPVDRLPRPRGPFRPVQVPVPAPARCSAVRVNRSPRAPLRARRCLRRRDRPRHCARRRRLRDPSPPFPAHPLRSSSVRLPASRLRDPWSRPGPTSPRNSASRARRCPRRLNRRARRCRRPQLRQPPVNRSIADPSAPASRWLPAPAPVCAPARRPCGPVAPVRSIPFRSRGFCPEWRRLFPIPPPPVAAALVSSALDSAADRNASVPTMSATFVRSIGVTSKPDRRRSIARSRSAKASRSRSCAKSST